MAHLIEGRAPPLTLWATHDTTLIRLLIGLYAWDGQWQIYADALVLEVYSSGSDTYFRLMHKGRALRLPHCSTPEGLPEGLCHTSEFLPADVKALKDPMA